MVGVSYFGVTSKLRKWILAGQDEHETLEPLFRNADLVLLEQRYSGASTRLDLAGPQGTHSGSSELRALVMRIKAVHSLREMTRLLTQTSRLEDCSSSNQANRLFHTVLSRFICKVGEDNLTRITEEKVAKLLKRNDTKDIDAVFYASFTKGLSTRDPLDNHKDLFDSDARVGRASRTFELSYKLHLSIDSKIMLLLTCASSSANHNEKKYALNMLENTKLILKQSGARLGSLILTVNTATADSEESLTRQ